MILGAIFSSSWMQKLITILAPTFGMRTQVRFKTTNNQDIALGGELDFDNLVIDDWYYLTLQLAADNDAGWGQIEVSQDGVLSTDVYGIFGHIGKNNSGGNFATNIGTILFQAKATTLRYRYINISSSDIQGDGTFYRTWARLTRPDNQNIVETTEWTP